MPITYIFGTLRIIPNEPFFTSDTLDLKSNTFLKGSDIKDLGQYTLTENDINQIKRLIPNFRLKALHKFVKVNTIQTNWRNEILFYLLTSYQKNCLNIMPHYFYQSLKMV